jgi:hypothetical protein
MVPPSIEPEPPLLIIVEGENDVYFLKAISTMLHRDEAALPDLGQVAAQRRAVFLPTGGSNFKEWLSRLISLHKVAFCLLDREQEPETNVRRHIVEIANRLAGCFATMTNKRALENYLHPLAIQEACGLELSFDDDTDLTGLLAREIMLRSGVSAWDQLPCVGQKRLREKAKKVLNRKAVQCMTTARLAQQDPQGEVMGWLQRIGRMTPTLP